VFLKIRFINNNNNNNNNKVFPKNVLNFLYAKSKTRIISFLNIRLHQMLHCSQYRRVQIQHIYLEFYRSGNAEPYNDNRPGRAAAATCQVWFYWPPCPWSSTIVAISTTDNDYYRYKLGTPVGVQCSRRKRSSYWRFVNDYVNIPSAISTPRWRVQVRGQVGII